MRELAFLYDEGRGVERNAAEAARLLLASYKAGNKDARLDVRVKSLAWSFATRREIQRQLTSRGLYAGPAHGVVDVPTRRALDRFASGD
jgi:TPR repeat protein